MRVVVLQSAAGIAPRCRSPRSTRATGSRCTRPDELDRRRSRFPAIARRQWFRKVGTRAAQAISKVVMAWPRRTGATAGRALGAGDGAVRIALGSVGADRRPARRAPKRRWPAARRIDDAQRILVEEIAPIDDIRSTAEYRRRVAANLLARFLDRRRNAGRIILAPVTRPFPHESRRRLRSEIWDAAPACGTTRTRWRANGVDVDLVGLEGHAAAARRSPTIRASRSTAWRCPRLKIRGACIGSTVRRGRAVRRDAHRASGSGGIAADAAAAGPRARPESAGVSDAGGHAGSRCAVAACGSSSTGTTSATRCCSCGSGQWHPAVRLARWLERRDARRVDANLCVSRGLAAFLESRFGVTHAQRAVRPAGVRVRADRARRARALPAGAVRAARASAASTVGFIVCPTSWTEDEDFDVVIDAVMRLEERIRGWEAGESRPAFPGSGDSGDRRRRAARGVRAALRRPAGATDSAARALARARGLSARRRQRRSGSVPPSLLVGPRHPDEDCRSVRRRRAGAARSTTARAWPSACATATTVCCSRTARQLADVLFDLFETFPADQTALERLRTGARKLAQPTWEEGWTREARPVLLRSSYNGRRLI